VLGLYAIFGGLIPPPVSFFPGNVLNVVTFAVAVGVPPLVFRSLIGLILAVTITRALEVFDLETERLIEAMEQQQILSAERERIGRELHDGAIQTVYTAGLLIESAKNLAEPQTPPHERLERAMSVLNDAIHDLRRNLGELRSVTDQRPLRDALQQLALDPRFRSLIDLRLDLDLPDSQTLSLARIDHVLAIVNEALANVIRHARANRVTVSAQSDSDNLTVSIQDNGLGIPHDPQLGYGLRNMRDRARLLGGDFELVNASGRGTLVRLVVPWRDER
jgi:signal transduction histidine kinase